MAEIELRNQNVAASDPETSALHHHYHKEASDDEGAPWVNGNARQGVNELDHAVCCDLEGCDSESSEASVAGQAHTLPQPDHRQWRCYYKGIT